MKKHILAIITVISAPAFAGTPTLPDPVSQPSATAFDQIWSLATLYKDPEASGIQEISLFGRFHANWASEQTDHGNWSDWEARRIRAGLKVKFWDEFEFKTEVRFVPLNHPVYDGLTEVSLNWKPDPAFGVTVGKQLPRYTQEGGISSNDLITVERSALANTFWVGEDFYSTGISFAGDIGHWNYYAAALSGETDKVFGKLNAGWYGVASLGYDFGSAMNVEKAVVRADYVYNDGNPKNTTTRPFQHTSILGLDLKQGKYGLVSNVVTGTGIGKQPDVWGFVLMPTYDLSKKVQLVARYTFLDSSGRDGIKPQRRYENEVPDINGTRGDRYQAAYLGLNYYIYGNKLKFQAGAEYSHMDDSAGNKGAFNAWSYTGAFRLSF